MRIGKQALGGAAVGALITSAVFVTVYEGKVLLANERGKTQIRAGERAAAGGGDAPGPAVVVKRAGKPSEPVAVAPPPPDGASREQLLARDDQQRKEIAALRAKLQTLEGATMEGGGPGKRPGETKSFMSPTHDELVEMAKTCTIQYDTPPLSVDVPPLPAKALAKMGLTDAEGEQVHKAFVEVGARALAQLRAIYVEVTGNTAAADDLTGNAMMREIEEKAGQDEVAEAARQLSQERAGLAPPPANLVARPPAERMLRIASHVGDELETEIGKALGPERAHELRAMGDGWPARSKMAGCRDQDNGDGEETEKQH